MHVWVFVNATGAVQAAQIERSGGVDFDIAAIDIAKHLRFNPARLGDQAVAAWMLVPITTAAAPEPCATMAVPLSAGVGVFADSEQLERPELGMLYRFRAPAEFMESVGMEYLAIDVFIYPRAGWPLIDEQLQDFMKTLEVWRERGDFAAYEVLGRDKVKVRVQGERRGRHITIQGAALRVKLRTPNGEEFRSYFVVVPQGRNYVKFRITHSPHGRGQAVVDEFVEQVLQARADRAPHCPPP